MIMRDIGQRAIRWPMRVSDNEQNMLIAGYRSLSPSRFAEAKKVAARAHDNAILKPERWRC